MVLQLNDKIKIAITDLTSEGSGVGRYEGLAVFVAGALPSEQVLVEIKQLKKNHAVADLLNVLQPAVFRRNPPCPYYQECGGCQLQHLTYDQQVKVKAQQVDAALSRLGGLKNFSLNQLVFGEEWGYRNRVQLHYADGKLGFYSAKTHQIIAISSCLLLQEEANLMLQTLSTILQEKTHPDLSGVVIKQSDSGKIMLIIQSSEDQGVEWRAFFAALPLQIASLWLNYGKKAFASAQYLPSWRLLAGEEKLTVSLLGTDFAWGKDDFLQVNYNMTEELYELIGKVAGLQSQDTLWDVYCGIGTIGINLALKVKKVMGVEISPTAVTSAKKNARLNQLDNCTYVAGQAEIILPQWVAQGERAEVIVIDPPRTGCEKAVLAAIVKAKPSKIIYVSCSPATLSRDLAILHQSGYNPQSITPVDLFPQTDSVECVVLLTTAPMTALS